VWPSGSGGPVHCLTVSSASRAQRERLLACSMTASGRELTSALDARDSAPSPPQENLSPSPAARIGSPRPSPPRERDRSVRLRGKGAAPGRVGLSSDLFRGLMEAGYPGALALTRRRTASVTASGSPAANEVYGAAFHARGPKGAEKERGERRSVSQTIKSPRAGAGRLRFLFLSAAFRRLRSLFSHPLGVSAREDEGAR
jgi:hypothetical protein